jgi:hypothetical protein
LLETRVAIHNPATPADAERIESLMEAQSRLGLD